MKTKTRMVTEATVTLTRAEAAALLSAVSVAIGANGGAVPPSVEEGLTSAVESLDAAFEFGIGEARP